MRIERFSGVAVMLFAWHLVAALLVLLALALNQRRKTNQTTAHPSISSRREYPNTAGAPLSQRLGPVLMAIDSIESIDSPELEDIRRMSDKLGRAGFNSSERKQIEIAVSQALEGKQVLWQLNVGKVSENPFYFYPEKISPGGLWVEPLIEPPMEWCPSLHVECQTFNRAVAYLQRGESIVVSGRIAKVDVLWSSFILIVSDTILSRGGDNPA
jgi:hypothetical protein